ncbi:hypothetical protein EBT31_02375, partial [bacterium]|nr:hypothetical protein [bacterium]
MAKGMPCLLRVAQKCLGEEGSTTVAAHSNMGIHGKGKSIRPKAVVEDGLAGMVDPLAGFTFQEPRAMLL